MNKWTHETEEDREKKRKLEEGKRRTDDETKRRHGVFEKRYN